MRILTLTTLYPNAAAPTHGIFVENRLRAMIDEGGIEARVIAPVPWFPSPNAIFGSWAQFAKAPRQEKRHGIEIAHPRYLLPPKIGMTWAAYALADCFEKAALKLIEQGWDFDAIDAHYYYPDGVAAVEAGRRLGKPVVVTARGTDINLIPRYARQRRMILEAAESAQASITVCQALKDEMVALGASADKISVLRNGVDLTLFRPADRDAIRERMHLQGPVLLSVGHLIERKGHHLVLEAAASMPAVTVLIAGDGPERSALEQYAGRIGIAGRVRFLGALPHEQLPELYNAADVLVLASSREGWPNVLLEAMACGTACVASPVWGTGEVINAPAAGRLAADRTAGAIRAAIEDLLAAPPLRADTRAYAEQFSWTDTAQKASAVLAKAASTPPVAAPPLSAGAADDWQYDRSYSTGRAQPSLLVTVDTEELFDWASNDFEHHEIADPADIARFQDACERHGIRPLYFLTWPLLNDRATTDYFRTLSETGRASLGLHLHGWVTPPLAGKPTSVSSYQCNLPPDLHRQKLDCLIEAFVDAFGFAPVSHRAGRYGVSPSVQRDLLERGVWLDCSPSAGADLSGDGGPDFTGHSSRPWWRRPDASGRRLLCLPVTGGRMLRRTRIVMPSPGDAPGATTRLGSLAKRITSSVRLSPEGFTLEDLQALSAAQLHEQIDLLTFSLHSSSLTAGATPYGNTPENVAALIARSEAYFDWFKNEKGGRFAALDEFVSLNKVPVREAAG